MRRLSALIIFAIFVFAATSFPASAHRAVATPQDPPNYQQQNSATLQSNAPPPSEAQQNAKEYSHARIVRLSLVEGDVQIARPEEEGWEAAISNLPIRQGDALATFRGRAEIEFENGATARMAENTRLQFTELALADGGRITRITLSQGTAAFYANLDKRDQFVVISPGVTVEIPDKARFRMDIRDDHTNVAVARGDVKVLSAAGEYKLSKQDGLVFFASGQNVQLGRIGEPDDFDRWVNSREDAINTARASTLRYVNAPFRYGLSDLSYHGNWIYVADYGYAWRPYGVSVAWGPYVHGRWVFLRHHGWTWVSYEPWGWVPYHYGRWAYTHYGWVWVPGYFHYWSPAQVVWFRFGRNYGWCPLGPFDRPHRGVWGRPRHFNNGVVVSTAGGVVQGNRSPGILRSELTGEPLNRPPTRAEVFGGRTELNADGTPVGRPAGFAGTRRDPDVRGDARGGRADGAGPVERAGSGPERGGRRNPEGMPREGAESPAQNAGAPAGFSGRPVDRADVDRANPRGGRGVDRNFDNDEPQPRPVPMSPEVMRPDGTPAPRHADVNRNVEFDRDEKKFVNRVPEGMPRDTNDEAPRANPSPASNGTPRSDAEPRNNSDSSGNGFAGSTGVPATGTQQRRPDPQPRDVTIPRGSDSGPATQRSEPTPRSDGGYGSRPSSSSSPSSGYGGSRPDTSAPRPSTPSPSSQSQSQTSQPRPSSPSPSSSTGFGGASRPSTPPPAAQPRPSSPPPRPQSNFQSQPRPSAPPHKPRPQ